MQNDNRLNHDNCQVAILNEGGKKTVNARELHGFLESKQDFSDWIKKRIEKYSFIENEDFSINLWKTSEGGRPKVEYHISLDMAKELSMVENNEKGQQARRYFIECEKKAQEVKHPAELTRIEILQMAIDSEQRALALEVKLEAQRPAVEFVKTLQACKDSMKIGDFAKVLFDKENLVIGQNRLFQWLKDRKYLLPDRTPYQRYMEMGLFEIISGTVESSESGRIWKTTKVTGRGMVYLTQKILESGDFKKQLIRGA